MSLSSRRAWIEIVKKIFRRRPQAGRSPHGERGLKLCVTLRLRIMLIGRSPHGERGLK